ncbi:hypothetical protein [Enterovirga aerilata]|uniref:Uncharacterized protein n=1 Tax=Enterovirga aerilata TaxID=2730920 RepID=A0A849I963_9HYPH|nr:hypothetical protein [Enterovirga sp. DB1703]NNM74344.1 hypothetical protein [Enterovirga sp. DB1703]
MVKEKRADAAAARLLSRSRALRSARRNFPDAQPSTLILDDPVLRWFTFELEKLKNCKLYGGDAFSRSPTNPAVGLFGERPPQLRDRGLAAMAGIG